MTDYTLPAVIRPEITKRQNNALRRDGYLIANLHGRGGSVSLALHEETWTKYLREMHKGEVLEIDIQGAAGEPVTNELVRVQDIMRTPLQNRILHIDFLRLERATEEEFDVPLRLQGVARGIKDGGVVEQVAQSIRVKCYPSIRPPYLVHNIADLKMNETHTASRLKLPSRVVLAIPADSPVVSCPKGASED
ncbi:MAG: 50S ribosomal protein L25 [bacterium]|nr:50S ribosomal protein L25 [bacterium]